MPFLANTVFVKHCYLACSILLPRTFRLPRVPSRRFVASRFQHSHLICKQKSVILTLRHTSPFTFTITRVAIDALSLSDAASCPNLRARRSPHSISHYKLQIVRYCSPDPPTSTAYHFPGDWRWHLSSRYTAMIGDGIGLTRSGLAFSPVCSMHDSSNGSLG
jgi:hypothetical protein